MNMDDIIQQADCYDIVVHGSSIKSNVQVRNVKKCLFYF